MSASIAPVQEALNPTVTAVILYDAFEYAVRARNMLERVVHKADENTLWAIKPWRLDMLMSSPVSEMALAEASQADLIVIAVQHQPDKAEWLMNWLNLWAATRQVAEAAVVLWDGRNGEGLFLSASELLQFWHEIKVPHPEQHACAA